MEWGGKSSGPASHLVLPGPAEFCPGLFWTAWWLSSRSSVVPAGQRYLQRWMLVLKLRPQGYLDTCIRFPTARHCAAVDRGAPQGAPLCPRVSSHGLHLSVSSCTTPFDGVWITAPDSPFPCSDSIWGLLTSFPSMDWCLSHHDPAVSCGPPSLLPPRGLWILKQRGQLLLLSSAYKILQEGTFIKPTGFFYIFPLDVATCLVIIWITKSYHSGYNSLKTVTSR